MTATVTREAIEKRVREAVIEFGVEPEELTPDASLATLDIDSLDLVELGQIIEEEFGIELKAEDAAGVETFEQVIDLIYAKAQ